MAVHECLSYDMQGWKRVASEYTDDELAGLWRDWEKRFPESDPQYNDTRWRSWRRVYRQEMLRRGLL